MIKITPTKSVGLGKGWCVHQEMAAISDVKFVCLQKK